MKLLRFFLFLCSFSLVTFFIYWIPSSELTEVEGWDLKRSRNVKDYITEQLLPHIIPEDFCIKQEEVLVMVQSKPSDNVSFFFLLGEVKDSPFIQSEVELESFTFGDIIQERFIDHYNNLTLKSISMLKLFSLYCAKSYTYLMKVDDDIFLNTRWIMDMLSKRSSSKDLLVGKLLNNTAPFRDSSNKWFMPYEFYPDKKYPNYLCGPTYVMSSDVAQKLYRCAMETPLVHIEDVYVTGICAKKINVTPEDDPHFTCSNWSHKNICIHKEFYSVHHHTPESLRSSYQFLENNDCASPQTQKEDSDLRTMSVLETVSNHEYARNRLGSNDNGR